MLKANTRDNSFFIWGILLDIVRNHSQCMALVRPYRTRIQIIRQVLTFETAAN